MAPYTLYQVHSKLGIKLFHAAFCFLVESSFLYMSSLQRDTNKEHCACVCVVLSLSPTFVRVENEDEIITGCLLHIQGVLYTIIPVEKKVESRSLLSPVGREHSCTHITF